MSEETPPPTLRLRPRTQNAEAASSPVPAAPVSPAAQPAAADEGSKRLRLKPKLDLGSESQTAQPVAVSAGPDAVGKPGVTDDGMPRLKLKPVEAAAAAPSVPLPSLPAVPVVLPEPPPVPTVAPAFPPPPVPPVIVKAPMPAAPPPVTASGFPVPVVRPRMVPTVPLPAAAAPSKTGKRAATFLAFVVLVLAVGGAAYYFLVKKPHERAAAIETPPEAAPAKVEAPRPAAPAGQPVAPAFAETAAAIAQSSGNSPAMSAFRVWVDSAHIAGVVASGSPRAIINGRLVKVGDVLDAEKGIVFDGVDSDRKEVLFSTKGGLFLNKPY